LEIVETVLSVNRKNGLLFTAMRILTGRRIPVREWGKNIWNAIAGEETKFPSLLIHRHFTINEITVSYSDNYYMIIARRK
jgi:hypothetical protein